VVLSPRVSSESNTALRRRSFWALWVLAAHEQVSNSSLPTLLVEVIFPQRWNEFEQSCDSCCERCFRILTRSFKLSFDSEIVAR
jgi:hypothetical protein